MSGCDGCLCPDRERELTSLVSRLGQTWFGMRLPLGQEERPVRPPPARPDRDWYRQLVTDT